MGKYEPLTEQQRAAAAALMRVGEVRPLYEPPPHEMPDVGKPGLFARHAAAGYVNSGKVPGVVRHAASEQRGDRVKAAPPRRPAREF